MIKKLIKKQLKTIVSMIMNDKIRQDKINIKNEL